MVTQFRIDTLVIPLRISDLPETVNRFTPPHATATRESERQEHFAERIEHSSLFDHSDVVQGDVVLETPISQH
jgi:hypothetical protein